MRTSDQKTPEHEQVGTEVASSSSAGDRTMGLTEAITVWGGQAGALGQGGPVDPWVVEGTAVLIAAVALHHKVSANGAV